MALFRRRRRGGREPAEERDDDFDGPADPDDDLRDEDYEDEFVEDDLEDEAPARGGWLGTLSRGVGAGIVAAVVVVGLYYAYSWGVGHRERPLHRSELPVVTAEEGPEKVRPEDPGGMEVPHQDKLLLNEGGAPEGEPKVERLLPRPEDPQPLPEAERAGERAAGAGESEAPTGGAASAAGGGDAAAAAASRNAAPASSEATDGGAASVAGAGEPASEVGMPEAPTAPSEQPQPGAADSDEGGRAPAPATAGEEGEPSGGAEADAATAPDPVAEPAPPRPRPGDALVQLAAFRDKATAERVWGQLRTRFPNVLGDQRLILQAVEIEGKGTFWRVRTGPFPNRATARDVCTQLKARDQACLVVTQ